LNYPQIIFGFFCDYMIKKLKYVITATLIMLIAGVCQASSNGDFVVVIDAGHGGKDAGCIGNVTNEKTITLDVAKRLAAKIKSGCSNTKVVLTRDDDYFLTLQERANVANKAHGDLFISIHINSVDKNSKNRTLVHGASVYAVGADKERNTLNVAMRENSVMELEDNYSTAYRGFDPNSAESYIIFELNNNLHLNQSLDFAAMAQKQLVSTAGRADKGVRQAGFWVLWATSMPAVLVELDFICNPTQEAFLNSADGRDKCATALYNAFCQYENSYVRKNSARATSKTKSK
jgi:N-acetylmuramoyl-L-alanine amidase